MQDHAIEQRRVAIVGDNGTVAGDPGAVEGDPVPTSVEGAREEQCKTSGDDGAVAGDAGDAGGIPANSNPQKLN